MINAVTKILNGTGLTLNSTYTDTDIEINLYQDKQTTKEAILKEILDCTDHIAYIDGTTFYLIDLLQGSTSYTLQKYDIVLNSVKSTLKSNIINRFEADLIQKELQYTSDGKPQLIDNKITRGVNTGASGGNVAKIKAISQNTTLINGWETLSTQTISSNKIYQDNIIIDSTATVTISNGITMWIDAEDNTKIGYDINYTNIDYVLNRKKSIYLKDDISLAIKGYIDVNLGQKIYFTEVDKNGNEIGSGNFVLKYKSYNIKSLITTLKGLGSYSVN